MKLPRVQRLTKKGLKYHRVTRDPLPANVPEDHPAFIAAWTAAEAKMARQGKAPRQTGAQPGSLTAVWRAFLASPEYLALGAVYRATLRRHGDAMVQAYGAAPFRGIRADHVAADVAKIAGHPALHRLKTWRILCKWAKASNLSPVNAALGVDKPRLAKTEGHEAWTSAEIEAFRARWPIDTEARKAMELLLWTAARTIDAVAIGRRQVADGLLTFRQSKTGNPAHVPWTAPLPDWAPWEADRQMLFACLGPGFTFLETQAGKPRTAKGLSNLISDAARAAGIEGKSAHGLRKARLTMIAEAGGSAHAIMAWGGHVTLSEAEAYTRAADRKRVVRGTGTERETCKPAGPVTNQAKIS